MACLIENIDLIILNYSNEHAVKVYAPKLLSKENGGSTPGSKDGGNLLLPKGFTNTEFTTAVSTKNSKEEKKGHSSKKLLSAPI